MFRTYSLPICLCLLLAIPASAQKEYRSLKDYLKAKNGTAALTEVEKLEAEEATASDPLVYYYGVKANALLRDDENKKFYLRQSGDSVKFFAAILGMFGYALRCDSVEQILANLPAKKIYKYQYRKTLADKLLSEYANLYMGAQYFYAHGEYESALAYFKVFFKAYEAPIFEGKRPRELTPVILHNSAFLTLKSAFLVQDYASVDSFASLALLDTVRIRNTYEILARTALAQGDSIRYVQRLTQGLAGFPDSRYFFNRLSDYMTHHGQAAEALDLADSLLLAVDPQCSYFLTGKARALATLERYDEALETLALLPPDGEHSPWTYYLAGMCLCNKAMEIEFPQSILNEQGQSAVDEMRNLYDKARPYLETFRAEMPEEKKRWAPLLYRIYLVLNMGPQFEEISTIMDTLK